MKTAISSLVLFLCLGVATNVFAGKSVWDRKSEEKIALIYGVSIVLAGLAIGGGIYLSRKSPKKRDNEHDEKG